MQRRTHLSALLCLAVAGVVALNLLGAPAPSTAAPASSTSPALQEKKAEQAQVAREIELTRIGLAEEVSDYIETGKQIERTRQDISQTATDLAAMQIQLREAQDALQERVVELYRGDREELIQMVFTAQSLQELWVRSNYLAKITERDVRLISDVRLARSENLWLQEGMNRQLGRLDVLQRQADQKRVRIEQELEEQLKRAAQLKQDIARLMWVSNANAASGGSFNPGTVISDVQFRASTSMSVEDVQSFLDAQPGTLDTYRARDHAGHEKSVAQMVVEAAQAWGISPKVILVKLQKEQSLLERRSPTQNAYDWAMGCGKADSRTFYQYKGFGKQVWFGAQKLAENSKPWHPGIAMKIDGSTVYPTNSATYSLFKYTPHFRGTMSFWLLFWRYFGDPLGA